jgi:hypothetical protein
VLHRKELASLRRGFFVGPRGRPQPSETRPRRPGPTLRSGIHAIQPSRGDGAPVLLRQEEWKAPAQGATPDCRGQRLGRWCSVPTAAQASCARAPSRQRDWKIQVNWEKAPTPGSVGLEPTPVLGAARSWRGRRPIGTSTGNQASQRGAPPPHGQGGARSGTSWRAILPRWRASSATKST